MLTNEPLSGLTLNGRRMESVEHQFPRSYFVLNRIDGGSYDEAVNKGDEDTGSDAENDADDTRVMLLLVFSRKKDASHD